MSKISQFAFNAFHVLIIYSYLKLLRLFSFDLKLDLPKLNIDPFLFT